MPANVIVATDLDEAKKIASKNLGKGLVITSVKRTSQYSLSTEQKIYEKYWKKKHYTIRWRKRKRKR